MNQQTQLPLRVLGWRYFVYLIYIMGTMKDFLISLLEDEMPTMTLASAIFSQLTQDWKGSLSHLQSVVGP